MKSKDTVHSLAPGCIIYLENVITVRVPLKLVLFHSVVIFFIIVFLLQRPGSVGLFVVEFLVVVKTWQRRLEMVVIL
jgi:hypothetical protein